MKKKQPRRRTKLPSPNVRLLGACASYARYKGLRAPRCKCLPCWQRYYNIQMNRAIEKLIREGCV